MIKIEYAGKYHHNLNQLIATSPDLLKITERRILWFRKNPDDTRLKNHELYGKLQGRYAFSITGDIRIVYRWRGDSTVQFLDIGSHETVYGRKTSSNV